MVVQEEKDAGSASGSTAELVRSLIKDGTIAACPECGQDDALEVEAFGRRHLGRIVCTRCKLRTSLHRRLHRAVRDWNENRSLRHYGDARAADGASRGSFESRERARKVLL